LIGEDAFPSVVHEGEQESIYMSVIGRTLLVVVFDQRSTLGLVKLRSKRASYDILNVLNEIEQESRKKEESSFFAEITDEEIDSLFS
ncbi:MAG: roadblock/LC7 domain-containing protein, partial [Pyrinomonadaceae bacterium]